MNDKTPFMKAVEEKSEDVGNTLDNKIFKLGYNTICSRLSSQDITLIYYKDIPLHYLLELKHTVDTTLGEYTRDIMWRKNKRIGWNLIVQLGKDIGL